MAKCNQLTPLPFKGLTTGQQFHLVKTRITMAGHEQAYCKKLLASTVMKMHRTEIKPCSTNLCIAIPDTRAKRDWKRYKNSYYGQQSWSNVAASVRQGRYITV